MRGLNSTPLIALDAVVLDTETTGLDPASADLVEVGAVRVAGGRIVEKSSFRRLVRPPVPIPAAATDIHGIDDAAVAGAPSFAEVWPELAAFIGDDVVIGHSIGFDLAILKRECERAGLTWTRPRSLCVRLLGEIAAPPDLAGSLGQLAGWLRVPVKGRHSALGDAATTAEIFLKLLPRLRAQNIRTLAEAEHASRRLGHVLADQHRAGWVEAVATADDAEPALSRIDAYPYRHRIAGLMSTPPQFVAADTPVGQALTMMMGERVSSLFVRPAHGEEDAAPRPRDTGIVTERDVLRAIAEHGAAALALPVSAVASRPLLAVPAEAFVYRAIGRMARLKVRHLGVEDGDGRVCGALSARDLLRLRAQEAVLLGDEIDAAGGVPELARAWAKLPGAAAALVAEGVAGRDIAAVISREIGELTRRAAALAEARLKAEGFGDPPCPYALAVLGSAGRGESLLAMDQDNAIVFAEGEPGGEADRWFEQLGGLVADMLHDVGVPYCKGGVMAKNSQWRGSLATWRRRVTDWIRRSRPDDLLSVDIFFDLAGVHGDGSLANSLWRFGFDAARGEVGFAKLLAESAGSVESGLTWFGGIKTVEGRIDLKKTGLFGIVTLARVLAIRHHVVERSTPRRLAGLAALGLGGAQDLAALAETHAVFLDLILAQQIADIAAGVPVTNEVAVKRVSQRDRDRLRSALGQVRNLDQLAHDLLFRD
jgi:CBS domain-containing protein